MSVQIPKSVKKIAKSLKDLAVNRGISHIDDLSDLEVQSLHKACGYHEMFHMDASRYLNDCLQEYKHAQRQARWS